MHSSVQKNYCLPFYFSILKITAEKNDSWLCLSSSDHPTSNSASRKSSTGNRHKYSHRNKIRYEQELWLHLKPLLMCPFEMFGLYAFFAFNYEFWSVHFIKELIKLLNRFDAPSVLACNFMHSNNITDIKVICVSSPNCLQGQTFKLLHFALTAKTALERILGQAHSQRCHYSFWIVTYGRKYPFCQWNRQASALFSCKTIAQLLCCQKYCLQWNCFCWVTDFSWEKQFWSQTFGRL